MVYNKLMFSEIFDVHNNYACHNSNVCWACRRRCEHRKWGDPMVSPYQAGTVKFIKSIKSTIGFLKYLGLLYKAFSVHLRLQLAAKLSITEAIRYVKFCTVTWQKQINMYSSKLTNRASLLVNMKRFCITEQCHLSAWFWQSQSSLQNWSSHVPDGGSREPPCNEPL